MSPGDRLLARLRGRLAGRLDRVAPPGPVLDIGAGDGALVDALRSRGRDAVGIERASSHPYVREIPLEDIAGSWAAIVFWHSLEHLPRAGRSLEQAVSLLAPGGVIVIAMPNPMSVQAAIFGDRWFGLDLPRHRVHVPASTLTARLERLGLRLQRVSHLRGGQVVFGWLHGLVGLLPGRPDLYDAIRRPEARSGPVSRRSRSVALSAAVAMAPLALACAAGEAGIRRGGTVYVEARRV